MDLFSYPKRFYYNYQIWYGLRQAKYYAETRPEFAREKALKAYHRLEKELERCPLQMTTYDLRDLTHDISPGLGHVDVIHNMVDAAYKKCGYERPQVSNP